MKGAFSWIIYWTEDPEFYFVNDPEEPWYMSTGSIPLVRYQDRSNPSITRFPTEKSALEQISYLKIFYKLSCKAIIIVDEEIL